MLASIFVDGVSIYAFYAMQPYLLQVYGDPKVYGVAGLAAAIVGGAQIGGGLLVPRLRRGFDRRTSVLLMATIIGATAIAVVGFVPTVLAGDRAVDVVGARLRDGDARASGVRQRPDSVRTARDRVVVRLVDGIGWWRGLSACAGKGG